MHGFISLSIFLVAIGAGCFVFYAMKAMWRLPVMLNFPGAALVAASVLSFAGWLTHDLFSSMIGPQPPDVPWYAWLLYAGLSAWFYTNIWAFLTYWSRKNGRPPQEYFSRTT